MAAAAPLKNADADAAPFVLAVVSVRHVLSCEKWKPDADAIAQR